jgi:hypothetical protein
MYRIIAVPVLVLTAGFAAWAQTRSLGPRTPAAAVTASPRTARVSVPAAKIPDAELERDIRARLSRSKLNADHLTVHVQGGVATLEGHVDVMQHKGTATRMAKNSGVTRVVNHIAISQAALDKANANLEKGRRRVQVKRGDSRSETATRRSSPRTGG